MSGPAARAVVRFFRAVDLRDWDVVRSLLADRVVLDYVSVFGGQVEELGRDDVVRRWEALLPGFEATQHFLGPLTDLAGDGTLECGVRGYHHLGGESWMVAGWYVLGLTTAVDAPRISGITLQQSYETGGRDLLARARERVDPSVG